MKPMASKEPSKAQIKSQVSPGQQILLTIKRLGINGEGIGHFKGQVVFVPGSLPGEVVLARIEEVHPNRAVGNLIKIKKSSAHRQQEQCPQAADCGGCQLLHMSYEAQLSAKKELVAEALKRYCGLKNPPVLDTAGMTNPWQYRNKAQFQVGRSQGRIAAGLYSPNSHQLVDLTNCQVQHPLVNKTIQAAVDILDKLGIEPFNERNNKGLIKTIVARAGLATGEVQLTLVTASKALPHRDELVNGLKKAVPELVSINQNINSNKTSLVFGEETILLWGTGKIRENLGKLQFLLSPRAFFQLNPEQTVKLYTYVRKAAGLSGNDTVVDAYCGVGTIALWLAEAAGEVRGIEIIPEAVQDASKNAAQMNLTNTSFYVGKAEELLPKWVNSGFKPDVIVVDPPRTGLDSRLMDAVCSAKPDRLVYVSCNPATLAKNCDYLIKRGFELKWVQPVDMFPHTSHVECVALIARL